MIDIRQLEIILSDQTEELEFKRAKSFCHRQEEKLVDLDSPQAQVVIGVRRSGKSTLCHNVLRHSGLNYAYVNFDDERLAKLKGEDLNNVLEVLYKIYGNFTHLFMDEIQNIPEVVECHFVTGNYTFLVKLLCSDHQHLMHILIDTLQNIPGITKTETIIALDQLIDKQINIPLPPRP